MASLNDVCFERIRDTFYYGMFGEFKLVVDKSTGCFNATKMCADGGKQFYNWSRLEKSKRLMEYCQSRPSYMRVGSDFYEVKGDNKDALVAKTTGQYVRKELILDIASWVSIEFYDKCNQIIIDFTRQNTKRV
jgi:KilA-N domain